MQFKLQAVPPINVTVSFEVRREKKYKILLHLVQWKRNKNLKGPLPPTQPLQEQFVTRDSNGLVFCLYRYILEGPSHQTLQSRKGKGAEETISRRSTNNYISIKKI